jgi:UDP-N-acetylglucosamine acyltransferase
MGIHATAIVDPNAVIGDDVTVGPFSIIGPNVTVGDGCVIGSRVSLDWTRMGAGCYVGDNSVVGGDPQIYNWNKVPSWVEMGEGVFVNELVAIHRSMYENGVTVIGPKCYVMTQVHIGHDCALGEQVTLTTLAGLSGHVVVGDFAVVGGAAGAHQFVRIGTMAMVGGMSRIVQDIPPYFLVVGSPAVAEGLNTVGLKRRGVSPKERAALKSAYKILTGRRLPLKEAIEAIEAEVPMEPAVLGLVAFARETKRGLTL